MLLYQIVVVAEVALVAVALGIAEEIVEVPADAVEVLADAVGVLAVSVGVLADAVGILADPVLVPVHVEAANSEYTAIVHSSLYLVELYRHKYH